MMGNKTMTVTDEIYAELIDGLKTGELDWPHFLAKYGDNKVALYNAIGRFLNDMEPQVRALSEVQGKLNQAELKLDSLNQEIKEAENRFGPLEEKRNALNEENKALETKLAEKSELLEHAGELEKLGFDVERLRQLREALDEIGTKHGLKGKEAAGKFFAELKNYDAKIGFEQEIQRLKTITETKKLEAQKWQAEAGSLARRYKELEQAITAVRSLNKQGVKSEQIVSWNNILTSLGGVEELEEGLSHYKSIQELLAAKGKEGKHLDEKVAKLNGEVGTLKEQRSEMEGAIRALRVSSAKEIERLSKVGIEKIEKTVQVGTNSIGQVGETALRELKEALSLVDQVSSRALEIGKVIGQIEGKLDKSKETREKTEALVSAVKARK